MPNQSPNVSSPTSSPPDLASIAATLQEAAQALLSSAVPREKSFHAVTEQPQEEIRCYRFSPLAQRCERQLLEEHNAEGLRELLFIASSSVNAFASLVELMDVEAQVDGVVMHILARELQRINTLLFKIQDAYSTVELIEA